MTFLTPTTAEGAPDVEDGMHDAVAIGIVKEEHPDWAGPNKFGRYDDGTRYRWLFKFVDGDGEDLYRDGDELPGIDTLTNTNLNVTSKTQPKGVGYLKAMMTSAEFARFAAREGLPADFEQVDDVTIGIGRRPVQLLIARNKNEWPAVEDVLPPTKALAAAVAKAKAR